MSDETKVLYCARDRVKADTYADENGPTVVKCPVCGQEEAFRDAVASAVKSLAGDMLGSAFSGLRGFKLTRNTPPSRWYLAEKQE